MLIHIFMVISGIVLVGLGLWSSHRLSKPLNHLGALLSPIGLVMALTGLLLSFVPKFFSG